MNIRNNKVIKFILVMVLLVAILIPDIYVLASGLEEYEQYMETDDKDQDQIIYNEGFTKIINSEELINKNIDEDNEDIGLDIETHNLKIRAIDSDTDNVLFTKEINLTSNMELVEALYIDGYILNDYSKKTVNLLEREELDFYYKEKPKMSNIIGTLKIRYVDVESNEDISKPEVLNTLIGGNVSAQARKINGYMPLDKEIVVNTNRENEIVFSYQRTQFQTMHNMLEQISDDTRPNVDIKVVFYDVDLNQIIESAIIEIQEGMKATISPHALADHYYVGDELLIRYDDKTEELRFDYRKREGLGIYTAIHEGLGGSGEETTIGSEIRLNFITDVPGVNPEGGNWNIDKNLRFTVNDPVSETKQVRYKVDDNTNIAFEDHHMGRYTVKMIDYLTGEKISESFTLRGVKFNEVKLKHPKVAGYTILPEDDYKHFTINNIALDDNDPDYDPNDTTKPREEDVIVFRYLSDGTTDLTEYTVNYYENDLDVSPHGSKKIADEKTVKAVVGKEYEEKAIEIDEYILKDFEYKKIVTKKDKIENNMDFNYVKMTDEAGKGNYKLRFLDDKTGRDIVIPEVGVADVGKYIAKAKDLSQLGYELIGEKEVKLDIREGQVSLHEFRYEKTSNIPIRYTVKYVDENKKAIYPEKIVSGIVGNTVTEDAEDLAGYELVGNKTQSLVLTGDEKNNIIIFKYKLKDGVVDPDPDSKPRPPIGPPGSGGGVGGGNLNPDKPVVPDKPIDKDKETGKHLAYIEGYEDGTVRPEANITREEVAAIIYRLLDEDYRNQVYTEWSGFPDVENTRWSNKYIATLANAGIVIGYEDGAFRPEATMTRAEFTTMIYRFANLTDLGASSFPDIEGHWAARYITAVYKAGWIEGYEDGTFRAENNILRAELVTMVNNMLGRKTHKQNMLANIKYFSDLLESKWYYEAMQEAINSHEYEVISDGTEKWTKLLSITMQ